jgi:PPP family 3-phenylpropionic acid transporter
MPQRFALLFAVQFASLGAVMPFIGPVLSGGGLTPWQVGLVLAVGSVTRLLTSPLSAKLADRLGLRAVLVGGALLAAVTLPLMALLQGVALLLLVQLVHCIGVAPVVPLSDAAAIAAMRVRPFDYGRVRAWGSIAFILSAVTAGQWVSVSTPAAALWLASGCLLATALVAATLPEAAGPRARQVGGVWEPLRHPGFRALLPASALIQGSHAVYYGFSTLHWQAAGLSAGVIGLLWAWGVMTEVVLFLWGRRLVERLGARGLATLAAAAGVLRWGVTGATTELVPLFLAQTLHALTFGAMHLAAIRALGALPAGLGARAQTLHASMGVGLASGALMLASGPLYATFGGHAFWAMAGLCALGVVAGLRLRG